MADAITQIACIIFMTDFAQIGKLKTRKIPIFAIFSFVCEICVSLNKMSLPSWHGFGKFG